MPFVPLQTLFKGNKIPIFRRSSAPTATMCLQQAGTRNRRCSFTSCARIFGHVDRACRTPRNLAAKYRRGGTGSRIRAHQLHSWVEMITNLCHWVPI